MTGVTAAQSSKTGSGKGVFGWADEGEGLGPGAGLGASFRSCFGKIGISAMTERKGSGAKRHTISEDDP